MEQTENGEQQRPVAGDLCNDSSDIEKQLPVAVVEKSLKPRKRKKKKKISNENGSPTLLQSITKRRKIPRDADAPKYPKTGYVRFTTERRDILKNEFPDLSVLEVTKKLADEWNNMSDENKKPYLEAAEKDKDRYKTETKEYNIKLKLTNAESDVSPPPKKKTKQIPDTSNKIVKPSDPVPLTNSTNGPANAGAILKSKVIKSSSMITPPPSPPYADQMVPTSGEIPIFTDQFLEHNRQIDADLKKLRKLNTDYEHQNSVLEKHVENMQNGIGKLTNETNDLVEENKRLQRYLDVIRQKLASALCDLAIPTEPNGANIENIDKYMNDLNEMAKSNSHGPASLNKAKDILRKIDFNISENVPKY